MNQSTKHDALWPLEPLIKEAFSAQERAYARYSHFPVGAAIYTKTGKIFSGANVENASYGLTVCAERNAVMQAVISGDADITTVVIVTIMSPPPMPCGMCLQVLSEFVKECEIISMNVKGERRSSLFSELLPTQFSFTGPQRLG